MDYRWEATSVAGFVQQVAVSYLRHGYVFYVKGRVPPGKDPRQVDRKLIERYDIGVSRWARARRKQAGVAGVQYLRYQDFFVLLATHGRHPIFQEEAGVLRDARRSPIRFHGYALSHRGGHPHVRIEQEEYLKLKAYLLDLAVHRSVDNLIRVFARLPFEPYAPVRSQVFAIWRAVNRARKVAGFSPVPRDCVRVRRQIVRPFEPTSSSLPVLEVA